MNNKSNGIQNVGSLGGILNANTTIKSSSSSKGLTYAGDYTQAVGDPIKKDYWKNNNVNQNQVLTALNNLSKTYKINIDWGKEIVFYTTRMTNEIIVVLRMWDLDEANFMLLLDVAYKVIEDINGLSITKELFDYSYTNKRLKQIKDFYETNYTLNYSDYIQKLTLNAQSDFWKEEVDKVNKEFNTQRHAVPSNVALGFTYNDADEDELLPF